MPEEKGIGEFLSPIWNQDFFDWLLTVNTLDLAPPINELGKPTVELPKVGAVLDKPKDKVLS